MIASSSSADPELFRSSPFAAAPLRGAFGINGAEADLLRRILRRSCHPRS